MDDYIIVDEAPQMTVKESDAAEFAPLFDEPKVWYAQRDHNTFYNISRELGDIDYGRRSGRQGRTIDHGILGAYTLYPVITAINVYSDKSWDGEHAAGKSLNDCFELTYYSYAEYFASGFKNEKWDSIFEPITKPLNKLGADDLRLVNYSNKDYLMMYVSKTPMWFTVASPTTNPEPQVLTFEWTMHTGEVYTGEIEYAPSQMSF